MRAVLSVKKTRQNEASFLHKVSQFLVVDLIPMVLLLAMMAFGMAWIAERLTQPRSVEIMTISAEHG